MSGALNRQERVREFVPAEFETGSVCREWLCRKFPDFRSNNVSHGVLLLAGFRPPCV